MHEQLPPPTENPTQPQPPGAPLRADASVGELVAQLGEQVSRLVRGELALAEHDAKQRAKRGGLSAGALGLAGGLVFFAVGCFAAAAVIALAMVIRPWAAALAVGVAFALVSGLLGAPGLWGALRAGRGVGRESIESVQADVAAVRAAARR